MPPLLGLRNMGRMLLRSVTGTPQRAEPELSPATPNLATLLRAAGYHVAFKGKWHLTKPIDRALGWTEADARKIERDLGFAEWEPPDAGEDIEAEHFGGGIAGYSGQGWDEDYTRQAEAFLADADLPEPFALVVSLVNPHDVLAYPGSYARGGYGPGALDDLGVDLPPTFDEDLSEKPTAHGSCATARPRSSARCARDRAQRAYVNFYAHLHRVVDAKVGRVLAALGDADDPASLRSRTVVVRTLRPRRDGPRPRRPAPEDVQRLRGDHPRAARGLQPGPVPAGARDDGLRVALRRRARRWWRWPAGRRRSAATAPT